MRSFSPSAPRFAFAFAFAFASACTSTFAFAFAFAFGLPGCNGDPSRPPVVDDSVGARAPTPVGGGVVNPATGDGGAIAGTIATAPGLIRGLAVTASDAYFLYVDLGDGGASSGVLARVPRAGGAAPQQIVTGGVSPRALTVSESSLYWIDDGVGGSSIIRFGTTAPVTVLSGLTSTSMFAARNDVIVVATARIGSVNIDRAPNGDAGAVQSMGIVLGEASPVRVVIEGANAYLLVSNALGGTLYRVALVGSVPEEIWTAGSGTVRDLAISPADGRAFVAWDRGDQGQIVSIPIAGGAAQPLVSPVRGPERIVVDGTDLFYVTTAGELGRSPTAGGGAVTTLATNLGAPSALAVADAVYVASGTSLVRVSR